MRQIVAVAAPVTMLVAPGPIDEVQASHDTPRQDGRGQVRGLGVDFMPKRFPDAAHAGHCQIRTGNSRAFDLLKGLFHFGGTIDQAVAQVIASDKATPALTEIVLTRQQWMARRPVLVGVMRSRHLSLARFASLLEQLTALELADLKQDPRLPRNLRDYVSRFSTGGKRRPAGKAAVEQS